MSEQLVLLARTYIEDETAPYVVSDPIIERWLNEDRQYVNSLQIFAEDYEYDNESLIYLIGYNYLTGVILKDGNGNIISDSDYIIDVFNGIVTFDSLSVRPDSVFITFNYHNFFEAVAQLWLYQAAKSRFDGVAKLGDESLSEDKGSRSYCIRKYWDYRQSKNIQMER